MIFDASLINNSMAVLEVEVTAVGLTFEGDGSNLGFHGLLMECTA